MRLNDFDQYVIHRLNIGIAAQLKRTLRMTDPTENNLLVTIEHTKASPQQVIEGIEIMPGFKANALRENAVDFTIEAGHVGEIYRVDGQLSQ